MKPATRILFFILSFIAPVVAQMPIVGDGLFAYSSDGAFGFRDLRGEVVIEPAWDRVGSEGFSDGLAAVMKAGKWGFIDTTGKVVAEPQWDRVRNFSDGIAIVSKDRLNGAIDKSGKLVVPIEWKALMPCREGLIPFSGDGIHYEGYFDRTGKVALRPPEGFGVDFGFSEGLSKVVDLKTRKMGFMDKEGKIVIPCQWNRVGEFSEGLASVSEREEIAPKKWAWKAGFVDKSGEVVVPVEWEASALVGKSVFSNGLAPVSRDGKGGFIDKTGKIVIPLKWATVSSFSRSGIAYVATVVDREWGWIDTGGDYIHRPERLGGGLEKFWIDFYPVFTRDGALDPMTDKPVLEYAQGEWQCSPQNPYFRLRNKSGSVISCRVLSVKGNEVQLIKADDRKEYTISASSLDPKQVAELREFAKATGS